MRGNHRTRRDEVVFAFYEERPEALAMDSMPETGSMRRETPGPGEKAAAYPSVGIVVPTYREVENIPRLVERLGAVREASAWTSRCS
jgi:hypothetical protein